MDRTIFYSSDESDERPSTVLFNYLFKRNKPPYNYEDLIRSYGCLLDCHLMVGDPNLGQPEKIPVCRFNLLIHSSVFRAMLGDTSPLGDPTGENTHITDVEPHIFKLMLRHMYGCLDNPKDIPLEMREELILCAEKYNVQPLVDKVCRVLTPTEPSDVYPALRCLSLISLPQLEKAVIYVIQKVPLRVLYDPKFLELNDFCVEFIVKQDFTLKEVQIWDALVKWAKHHADINPGSSLRQLMTKPLRHIRFATMSHRDIVESVIPINILSPEEIVKLYQAIENKEPLDIPGLCRSVILRCKDEFPSITREMLLLL